MQTRTTIFLMVVLTAAACGRDAATEGADASGSLAQDSEIQQGALETSYADAAQVLADSNQTSDATALLLASPVTKEIQRDKIKERTCVKNADGTVTTNVTATVDRSFDLEGPVRVLSRTVTGSDSVARTWTSDSLDLDCTASNHVDIDWAADIAGLELDVTIDRSRTFESTMENKKKGTTTTSSKTFTVDGARHVTWLTHEELADSSEIRRTKSVTSSVERTHSFLSKKGTTREMNLTVATGDEAPLAITVHRDATTLALKEKTITSGTLVATQAGKGRMETIFSNLKFIWDTDSCAVASGTVTSHVYEEGGTTPVQSMELTVVDGDFTLTDLLTGEEVADFDLPECARSDFTF